MLALHPAWLPKPYRVCDVGAVVVAVAESQSDHEA